MQRALRPTREERRAIAGQQLKWLALALYLAAALAWLWPPAFERTSTAYVLVSWATFLVRVLSFYLGLAALVVAVRAATLRRWALAVALLPLVVVLVVAPIVDRPDERAAARSSDARVRVMTVNLLVSNHSYDAVAREVRDARPDVVVFQEYSERWDEALRKLLGRGYVALETHPRDDSFGVAAYVARDVADGSTFDYVELGDDGTPQLRVEVPFGDARLAVYDVHLLPPINLGYVQEGRRQFVGLLDALEDEELPSVVAGDLNLTPSTPQHHALRDAGHRDAWELAERGRGTTWPDSSVLRFLPGLRLDHLYLSRGLTATRVRVGEANGSDHRPVVADIAVAREHGPT